MDISSAMADFEAALNEQLSLTGADSEMEAAAEALLAVLHPTMHRLALGLAEQAAEEVSAQLPDYAVEVVLSDGQPALTARPISEDSPFAAEDLEARLTVRLPSKLKALIEEAAADAGDSVNTYVFKSLSSRAHKAAKSGRRFSGTIQT